MVSQYTVFGRQVGSHHLAIATLTTLFGGAYLMVGGKKAPAPTPPINASSTDELDFIKKFMESADADEKKAKQ